MCYERYKGYSICSHADPQSTPTESKQCDEFLATGRCIMGKKYILITSESTPALCRTCWEVEWRLEDAVGSLDDTQSGSDTWKLWYRIGWPHKELMLVVDIIYVCQRAQAEMYSWNGPRHNGQFVLVHWTAIFREFQAWLGERLEKRNALGQLYFPPGEERDVRIEKKKVLQHLVRWMLVNLAQGRFDNLDIPTFRQGLEKAFSNLVYEWDTHFLEEPGCDLAKEEFSKYWTSWFMTRERALYGDEDSDED
ncbi:hypothetical protein F5Y03DRAFT_263786 [Xylaria venustula]|nr:hypothetical protein F5Y03DRAFT_263786 [Xylaria venustula]